MLSFFVLWYVDGCFSKALLGVAFLHGEARVTICWTQGVIHLQEECGIADVVEPDHVAVVIGDDFKTLCGTTLCPFQVMRAKFCVESHVVV